MSKRDLRPRHYLEYAGWLFAAGLLKLLPRRATVLYARLWAWILHRVFRLRRATLMENLRTAFGDTKTPKELDRIALRSLENMILTFYEFVQPEPFFGRAVDLITSCDASQAAQFLGRGAIVITAHIGNWEALGSYGVLRLGLPLVALMKPIHNPLINAAVVRQRRRLGMELISTDENMKVAITAARKGKWLTILADQDARRGGTFVDFFGRPASTPEGQALFAWKLNLPIIPAVSVRVPGPRRELAAIALPPILPDPSAPRDAEIRRLTEAHVRALEEMVRLHPESYFWLHRRWKTRPKRRWARPGESRPER
jgi:KDO2-lipid IV(A) lauroyltransferase